MNFGAIALSYPPIVIDDSSWKNVAESFTVALTLTLGGYESAIAPEFFRLLLKVDICSVCKCNYLQTWLSILYLAYTSALV